MSTIIEPPDAILEPRTNVLRFPADDFATPEPITWREWARLEIDAVRARRGGKAVTGQPEPENRSTGLQVASEGKSDGLVNVKMPTRTVPDSFIDGRPTVNTAVRAILPDRAERLAAERKVREML